MPQPTATELKLFEMLAIATMDQGGRIEAVDLVIGHEVNEYVMRTPKAEFIGGWAVPDQALDNLYQRLVRMRKTINDVAFFAEPGKVGTSGVPWSFLKKDMPFLRIVLGNDSKTLRSIIERLEGILADALADKKERKP